MASTLQLAKPGDPLWQIIASLRAHEHELDAPRLVDILAGSNVCSEDVSDFIAPTRFGYGRRRIVRTDRFEALVMTWLPGQCTGAHDHGGVHSVFRILSGRARETRFVQRADGLIEPVAQGELKTGEVGSDAGELIHDIRNDGVDGTLLVSLHVYAPPLPELRRFTVTGTA